MIHVEMKDRIIVPVDTNNIDTALYVINSLRSEVGMFKFGLEMINTIIAQLVTSEDTSLPQKVRCLFELTEGKLFWDGKWDDIPNTIKGAANALIPLKPRMVNVHASSGIESVRAAKRAANSYNNIVYVLGVTVLTSLTTEECFSIFGNGSSQKVLEFADMLLEGNADGIICSPRELLLLKDERYDNLIKVIPGVRPEWADVGDQKRVMTPGEAIKLGADYLVIGRPITNPPKEIGTPIDAVYEIIEEMEAAIKNGQ